MLITDILKIENIVISTPAQNKNDALKSLVCFANRNNPTPNDTVDLLIQRETKATSGFGKGVAIPSIIHKTIQEIHMSLVIFDKPVDWDSRDGQPVRIACAVLVASRLFESYRIIMTMVGKILSDDNIRSSILNATNVSEILSIIKKQEKLLG
jgi:mannitol/fructose-specific phosphotransferase system IIA component (Ntr-type)